MQRSITKTEIVVLGVVFVLLGLLSTVLGQVNTELDNRRVCAANLRGIAQSANVYAADNADAFPLLVPSSATTYDVTLKEDKGSKNADAALESLYKEKKYSNNPSANLWLMVLTGQVAPKQFICKSDSFANKPATTMTDAKEFFLNFQDSKNISYSSIYPWAEKDGKVICGGQWKCTVDASLPILSDMAPYLGKKAKEGEVATRPASAASASAPAATAATAPTEWDDWATRKAASQNHQFQGQTVAFGDGHAEFLRTALVGQNSESIWGILPDAKGTLGMSSPEEVIEAGKLPHAPGGTMGAFDTVMVPTRDAKGNLK